MHGYPSSASKGNTHLVDAIVQGAVLLGEDGRGQNGITGYFKQLALCDPKAMAQLLGKALRWPTQSTDKQSAAQRIWTTEELNRLSDQEIANLWFKTNRESPERDRNTLAQAIVEGAALAGEDGTGKGGLAGYLKRLARRHPKAAVKLVGKALPWPTELLGEESTVAPRWTQEKLSNLSSDELHKLWWEEIGKPAGLNEEDGPSFSSPPEPVPHP
jgi:hypothetical protein